MKKRVSKRLTRPGGVIARAIRNRLDGSGSRPASVNGAQGPSSFARGPFSLAPEAQPGLLAGLADRGDRQRLGPRGRDLRAALQQVGLELPGNRRGHRNAVIGLVDTAAGKDELAGHEHDLVVALADQDLRHLRRCDRPGSGSRRPSVGSRDGDRPLFLPACLVWPAPRRSLPSPLIRFCFCLHRWNAVRRRVIEAVHAQRPLQRRRPRLSPAATVRASRTRSATDRSTAAAPSAAHNWSR